MSFPTMRPLNGQPMTNAALQNRPFVLHEGQLFHGQIKQLFPGQMAEVQIGGQKLVANLEVPMKAGDAYYFQVSSVKPELQLKIIAGPLQVAEGQGHQLAKLMEAMQLPKTPEMQSVLAFIVKNKIPMTREGLLQAANLLKDVPANLRNEALASIQRLADLKLPFTESIFRSLLGVEAKESTHALLTTLKSTLAADATIPSQQKEGILTALDRMVKPFAQGTGGVFLGQAVLTLLNQTESPENRFAILQVLKNAGILPAQASLANLQQVLSESMIRGGIAQQGNNLAPTPFSGPLTAMNNPSVQTASTSAAEPTTERLIGALRQIAQAGSTQTTPDISNLKALIAADREMSNQQKAMLLTIIDRLADIRPSHQATMEFVREFTHTLLKVTSENAIATPFGQHSPSEEGAAKVLSLLHQQGSQQGAEKMTALIQVAGRSDNPAVRQMVQGADASVATAIDGKAMKDALQAVIRSSGFNYEAELASKERDPNQLMDMVKPQLVKLLQSSMLSPAVREAAENVVMRMNGPLLQSGENGVQHQLVMQVPLDIFGKRIDSTLQWHGRMKENGQIDSDFARVLFYLDLASIKQTVIDMQVQNRVVKVTVFNEDDKLQTVALPLQNKLKDGLEAAGYRLSGIFFKPFVEEEKPVQNKQRPSDGQGVDVRI
ncbi:hypothetical protein MHZ95_02110 [Sporosarcina sp. ACRSM]|uniref:hypothetical protein n=1 Tax=Sporosarcina sp. ACRSM TaxID=2918216 RepID=UPI001EF60CE2|nr:hypothetical protein [Sporosarcina sp. ACRSM]MCG7334069.1 hypothetical protein [Sporosarcina sp. ACRSM]